MSPYKCSDYEVHVENTQNTSAKIVLSEDTWLNTASLLSSIEETTEQRVKDKPLSLGPILVFFFGHPTAYWVPRPGMGSDPSHHWELHTAAVTRDSLTTVPSEEPMSGRCKDATDPTALQWELSIFFFFITTLSRGSPFHPSQPSSVPQSTELLPHLSRPQPPKPWRQLETLPGTNQALDNHLFKTWLKGRVMLTQLGSQHKLRLLSSNQETADCRRQPFQTYGPVIHTCIHTHTHTHMHEHKEN